MHKMFPRVHHMEVMLCRTPPTAVREISYHIIKATNHRIFRMMSIQRRIKEHCKNIWKTEVQAYMSGQGMRQLQNFVYFLGKIALQNIYWLFLRPYCTLCDQQEEMDQHRLLRCTAFSSTSESQRYREARGEMGERRCQHTWVVKAWGNCKILSTFWARLPCKTSTDYFYVLTAHFVINKRRWTAPFVETHCFPFNIWKPKIQGGKRWNGWKTLSTYMPFQFISK